MIAIKLSEVHIVYIRTRYFEKFTLYTIKTALIAFLCPARLLKLQISSNIITNSPHFVQKMFAKCLQHLIHPRLTFYKMHGNSL